MAAIARQPAYRRSFSTLLVDRLLQWLGDLWNHLVAPLEHSVDARLVAIALAALLVAVVVARLLVAARVSADGDGLGYGTAGRVRAGDPWADAQRLAAAGLYTAAAHALYAALLTRLAGRGAVRLHPSKTAGDYARELRARGALEQEPFQVFRTRYDRLIYGAGACSSDDYAALVRDAQPLLGNAA